MWDAMMITRMTRLGAVTCLLSLSCARGLAQGPLDLDQVIEGLERREKLFFESRSMLIRYERVKTTRLTAAVASGGGLLPAEWTVAYHGDKWFVQRRFAQPFETKEVVVAPDPKTNLVRDQLIVEWEAGDNQVYLDSFKEGRNIYAGLYYTRNLSLDAPKHIANAAGVSQNLHKIRKRYADEAGLPFLPEFLRENRAHYRVLSKPQEIEGVRCWVVEWPDMDWFCVAVDRGFAVPRRRFCWGPGKPLRFEFRNSDYQEVKPGLWLPFRQVVDRYASIVAAKESLWGKAASRSEYRLKSLEIDDVPESLFDLELPAGTMVHDFVRDFNYVVSGEDDSDPFAAAIKHARDARRRSLWRWLGALLTATVLLLLVAQRIWAKRRGKLSLGGEA